MVPGLLSTNFVFSVVVAAVDALKSPFAWEIALATLKAF